MSSDWLRRCIASKKILPESSLEACEVSRFAKAVTLNAPRRARLAIQGAESSHNPCGLWGRCPARLPAAPHTRPRNGLFSTSQIHGVLLYGSYPHPMPPKSDLSALLHSGQAANYTSLQDVVKFCVTNPAVTGAVSAQSSSEVKKSSQRGGKSSSDAASSGPWEGEPSTASELYASAAAAAVTPSSASAPTPSERQTVLPAEEAWREAARVCQFVNKMVSCR